ncbi:MAG TPA: hypothetical protein VG246_00635 [Acidimicrobiales bacterium]|nr:hypothetical protein [Acidimicrobiales bacterium]
MAQALVLSNATRDAQDESQVRWCVESILASCRDDSGGRHEHHRRERSGWPDERRGCRRRVHNESKVVLVERRGCRRRVRNESRGERCGCRRRVRNESRDERGERRADHCRVRSVRSGVRGERPVGRRRARSEHSGVPCVGVHHWTTHLASPHDAVRGRRAL